VTNVTLRLATLQSEVLAMPGEAQTWPLGDLGAQGSITFPETSLRTVYDTAVAGDVLIQSALLSPSTAPGALSARDQDGTLVDLELFGIFELRILQPTAQLVLAKPATLSFQVDAGPEARELTIYRFDESSALYVQHSQGTYDPATQRVSFEVEASGVYAAAQPITENSCAKLTLEDAQGTALPHAAVRYASTRRGKLVWTDEAGTACVEGEPNTSLLLTAFARSEAGGLVVVEDTLTGALPEGASTCSEDQCLEVGVVTAQPVEGYCVRGMIAANVDGATVAVETSGSEGALDTLKAGDPFCFDLTAPTSLTFFGQLDCDPIDVSAAPIANTCGEDSCLDVGTVKCCGSSDQCGNQLDDDCDDTVDEGCSCGGTTCTEALEPSASLDGFCCTQDDKCGARLPEGTQCFEVGAPGYYIPPPLDCPSETLSTTTGSVSLAGCCRDDSRCGYYDIQYNLFGCIPHEESQAFWSLTNPSLGSTCNPQP
jgi:hypothetical protein